jgi:DNA polymerase (family 10)
VKALQESLNLQSLDDLKAACRAGRVAELKGFGAKSQQKILDGLEFLGQVGNRIRIDQAEPLASAIIERIRALPGVIRAEVCGSLRRRRETVKDIDILASSDDPAPIMDAFVHMPEVIQVTGHGDTKSSVVVATFVDGQKVILNADLRVVTDQQFPFALHHFTGSKEHNIRMRGRAQDRGMKINEYELLGPEGPIPCKDEKSFFHALGLEYIPPEMREDTGEVALAERDTGKRPKSHVPHLIEVRDIRGVFHNHTTASDGRHTLEEMALAAKQLGLEYLGIADHSQSLTIANGLNPARVRKQWKEIDALNNRLDGIRLLKGIECDILEDGSLDYDDDFLAQFEYVVASVHTHFGQPIDVMTQRIVTAVRHPMVTMLGHSTGRLLLRREGYKVDLDTVLEAAAESGTMIEINAQPMRLDLDWIHAKKAKALGIKLVINPDAHSTGELAFFRYGVDVARRAWLTKADVLNTLTLDAVLRELDIA